jgi:hypothetical protein
MSQIPIAAGVSGSRETHPILLAGRSFDLTLWQEPNSEAWHWTITAPGVLSLLGEAKTRSQAIDAGRRAGLTLARLARRPDKAGDAPTAHAVSAPAARGFPPP